MPSEPVVCVFPGYRALAGVAEKVTVAPLTGLSYASITLTLGGVATAVPTIADWVSPPFLVICVAGPAVPVAENVKEVVSFTGSAEAVSVFDPAVVPSVQLVTVAVPSLSGRHRCRRHTSSASRYIKRDRDPGYRDVVCIPDNNAWRCGYRCAYRGRSGCFPHSVQSNSLLIPGRPSPAPG